MKKPLVTVLCITYNHEKYIRACLESLVNQKCDFPFEIIIHDDASTDGTQAIVKEFCQKHPELITPILQTENQWSKKPGLLDVFFNKPLLKGTYIALCEGDDYWIGKNKLQKQVDILERHPECSVTCGAYYLLFDETKEVVRQNKWKTEHQEDEKGRVFELNDLTDKFFIKTSTTLFRNIPALFEQLKKYDLCLDMHLFYHLLKTGRGYYNKDVIVGYNRHENGMYSGSNSREILLAQYLIFKNIYDNDGDEFIRKQYLKLTILILNLKISGLMPDNTISQRLLQDQNPSILKIVESIKPVLQSNEERRVFYKSLIPLQAKVLKQKLEKFLQSNIKNH